MAPREPTLSLRPRSEAPGFGPYLLLALLVLILRLPFFFEDVIDSEESTLVLMGQAWLDGWLPYVQLWDEKPPLCFAAFALFIELFGRWVPGVRIGGALCVWLAAAGALRLGHRMGGSTGGWLAGVGAAIFMSIQASGQATLSETVAAPALLLGVSALALRSGSASAVLGGAALGVASLVRIDLLLVLVAALVLLLVRDRPRAPGFLAGLAAPFALLALVYGVAGHLSLWLRSVFVAPAALIGTGVAALPPASERPRMQIGPRGRPSAWLWWLVSSATVLVSTLSMGGLSGHGWNQFHPLAAAGLGGLVGRGLEGTMGAPARRWVAGVGLLLLVGAGAWPLLRAYRGWLDEPFPARSYGTTVTVARTLEGFEVGEGPVFMETAHLAYWHLGLNPPTRMAAQPENLLRAELLRAVEGPEYGPAEALAAIFDAQPLFVVTKPGGGRFAADPELQRLYLEKLKAYELRTVVDGVEVYELVSFEE